MPQDHDFTTLEAAVELHSRGWMPIPIPSGKKAPSLRGWQKLRLSRDDLPAHFTNGQNVGLLLGEPSDGLLDIDLDWPEASAVADDFLPATDMESGRPGAPRSHRWYCASSGAKTKRFEDPSPKDRQDHRATIVEIRGTGAQTLVPPSYHPNGEPYIWYKGLNPSRVSSDLLMRAVAKVAACALLIRHWRQGIQHQLALSLTGTLLRSGWTIEDTQRFIIVAARTAADDEIEDRARAVRDTAARFAANEVITGFTRLSELLPREVTVCIVRWLALQYGGDIRQAPSDETDWSDPEPLPIGLLPVPAMQEVMLPNIFAPWVTDTSDRMQCPLDYPAIAAVVALAATVGNQIAIRPKRRDDWIVVPNLFGAVVGRPGVLKSPALEEALRPIKRLALQSTEEYQQAIKEWEIDRIAVDARKEKLKDEIKKAIRGGESVDKEGLRAQLDAMTEIVAPSERRYIINDSTVEKVGELLNQNPRGLLLFRDELIGWLRTLDRDGHEGDRAFYLEAWNGQDSFTYDRIGRGTLHIKTVTLSVIGGIQPGPLSAYLRATLLGGPGDDGLLQRLQLMVYPDVSAKWQNVDRDPNIAAKNRAFEVFQKLDRIDAVDIGAFLPEESHAIPYLRFEETAQQFFDSWREELEVHLRSGQIEYPALEAHLSKYRSLMPSLALLFHLVDRVGGLTDQTNVSLEAAKKASLWCDYLLEHAKRIYGMAINAVAHLAKSLAEHIQTGDLPDPFTARDVYRKHWAGLTTSKEVAEPLELLSDLQWIQPVVIPTGGRSMTNYLINPKVKRRQ